jgi:hypothetical protein
MTLDQFNEAAKPLSFTAEREKEGGINFLDVSIHRHVQSIKLGIYRKPTATDIIIPWDSNHPTEHKLAAIRFLINRVHTYPISEENKTQEDHIIRQITQANRYQPMIIYPLLQRIKLKTITQSHTTARMTLDTIQDDPQPNNKKFAIFTYIGKETKYITKLFKHTNIRITYKTPNTIGNLLCPQQHPVNDDNLNKSGIYQLTCPDCSMKYIGQTGRSFRKRYQEHLRDYKYRTGNSKFAQHLANHNHAFGPINKTLKVLKIVGKGAYMDTLEKYHIHRITSKGLRINDRSTMSRNLLFDTLVQYTTHRGHPCIPYGTPLA